LIWALVVTPIFLATWEAENQEDRGSKPAWANSSQDPISKKPGLVEWLKVKALSSSSSTAKKKKKKINSNINRKREEKPMDVGKAFGKI
jgi:hypothetical protein